MIHIALLGLGTVGSGIYEIINNAEAGLKGALETDVKVKKVLVKNIKKIRNVNINKDLLTNNASEILSDPEIDIVVEVMGGINPAYEYICEALESGKDVVTANKEIVAKYRVELEQLAKKNNRSFLFEASVGGGIPIIKSINHLKTINDISQIKGILNGTTNFILTKMENECLNFIDALQLAKDLGYAESDPTDDIEGNDVARKLAILMSIAFKTKVKEENILYRGITSINKLDISYFNRINKVTKLVAMARLNNNRIDATVEPVLVDKNSQFANVKDAFNVISVTGNIVQELQFYGQGAGKRPTANAVISDIVDIIKYPCDQHNFKEKHKEYTIGFKVFKGDYYLRTSTEGEFFSKKIINLLKEKNLEYETEKVDKSLVTIIKSISTEDMEVLVKNIKAYCNSIYYARIES